MYVLRLCVQKRYNIRSSKCIVCRLLYVFCLLVDAAATTVPVDFGIFLLNVLVDVAISDTAATLTQRLHFFSLF